MDASPTRLTNHLHASPAGQTARFLLSGTVIVLLGVRLFYLVDQYAINLLFWDQWDYYDPIFKGQGLVQLFIQQHGPHRQGLGEILTWIATRLTGWNSRADAFLSLAAIVLAGIAALWLKRRLCGGWSWTDAIIPAIFLTVSQFETLTISLNLAHSALPLLLVMLYGLAWTLPNRTVRLAGLVALTFVSVFTGFGLFLGAITPLLLAVEMVMTLRAGQNRRAARAAAALALSLVSIGLFFFHYHFDAAVACFQLRADYLVKYPLYAAVIFGRFLGIDYIQYRWLCLASGGMILLAVTAAFLASAKRMLLHRMEDAKDVVISAMAGFSLLFMVDTAIGRVCLGMGSAYSSRYTTLSIPALFALYLFLVTWQKPATRKAALAGFLLVTAISLSWKEADQSLLGYFTSKKQEWKTCYLDLKDAAGCNQQTGFAIYPNATAEFQAKLDYLQEHHFNLFLESGKDGS